MDIAIVGLGCRFPQARDPVAYWDLIRRGQVTFRPIPKDRWDHSLFFDPAARVPDKTYIDKGAYLEESEIREFGALHFGLAPRRLQVTDPQHRLLLDAVRGALQDAGYETKLYDRSRTGVFIGASANEHKEVLLSRLRSVQLFDGAFGRSAADAEAVRNALVEDVAPMRAFSMPGNLLNMSAAIVAQTFDLGGPAMSIDAACSSALVASQQAVVNLRARQVDVAIAGGVYINLLPDNLVSFARIGAISRKGECRPFDAAADGFVMGEGVGAVVLKRLDDALRDGDRIYAVVKGAASNNDGKSEGPMTPRAGGQLEALRMAYRDAGFSPATLGYVEAHGTATTVGDAVEVSALRTLFEEAGWSPSDGARTAMGSVKANIGHTMSAAGIAGLIKAALALHHKALPPQPSIGEENPKLQLGKGPFFLPRTETAWETRGPRRAGVSSFGFGGTNAHLALEEAPQRARKLVQVPRGARSELFLVGGPRASVVARYARQLAASVRGELPDLAFTLSRRAAGDARLAIVADSVEQLRERLLASADALEKRGDHAPDPVSPPAPSAPVQLLPGAVFAQGPFGDARVALLFPGQGAQKVGLLREAYEQLPAFAQAFDALDDSLGPELHAELGGTLRSFLYATPSAEAEERLMATQICQPVMAALGLALHALLSRMGLRADFTLGHSLGEFAAAAAAGIITPEECVRLVAQRGLAMTRLPEAGSMASAAADAATVAAALQDGAVVANLNHPKQTVISGNADAVRATSGRLAAQGVQVTPLQVSHAFHSPLMSGIDPAMRELLAGLQLRPATATVVSGITGRAYPSSPADIRDIWLRHGTAPVDFVSALRSASSARVFVQAGAGSVLTSFVRETLPAGERPLNVSLASREEDGLAQLSLCLGQLWSIGVPLDFGALYEGRSAQLVTLPPTAIDVQPYWAVERPKTEREPLRLSSPAQEKPMPVDDPLVALFREQVALLTQQAKTLEARGLLPAGAVPAVLPAPAMARFVAAPQTNGELGRTDGTPADGAPSAQGPAIAAPVTNIGGAEAVASAAKAASIDKVATAVLASVARISAFPVEAIQPSQTLNGDLGFDSLMTVELDSDVSKAFPGVGALPRSLLGPQTTVQHVIDHVAHALASPAAKAAPTLSAALGAVATEKPDLLLFATRFVETKLHEAPADDPLPKRIHLTRDSLGVSAALARKLRSCGHEVVDAADGMGALVHLAALDGAGLAEALRLARAQPRGGMFVVVAANDTEGLAAFARSLAREREGDLVKFIHLREDSAEAMAEAVFGELRSGDAAVEVRWSGGVRSEPDVQAAPAGEPISLGEGDVVLVTGGSRGIGRKLAAALHADGATVILAGRGAPQGALGERETFLPWDLTQPPPALPAGITALVHAAGVTEDAAVRDTDLASLERVLAPKLHGLDRALAALQGRPLRAVVGISSWAARFGNAAQAGYAAANAAMEARLARLEGMRTLSLQYPPWDGTAMVAKIPPLVRRALEEQGVPFIDDAQGIAAFRSALRLGTRGAVLLAQTRPSRAVAFKTQVRLSRAEHPFLDDHQLAGQPVLPLASALDLAAQAAADAVGKRGTSLAVRDFRLQKPIRIAESAELSVAATGERELAIAVFARPDSSPSYSAFAVAGADVQQTLSSARPAGASQGPVALPMALDEFYDSYTFHGPRLRGIKTIEQLDSRGIVGSVRTSKPSDWIAHPGRSEWAVDPLAIDGAFQLAAYWAWTHLQRAGFPVGIEEYVQLEPLRGTLRASLQLEQSAGDEVRGSIVLQASDGRVVALMLGVTGEFKHRDPRFLRGRGPTRSTPPQVQPAQAAVPRAEVPTQPAAVATPNVPSENYRIEEFAEVQELEQRLGLAAAFGLKNPYFNVHERVTNDTSVIGGRTMINWSSYNYLGLSGDPAVTHAAQAAVERYGTSVSASRIASGEKPLHRELEEELARLLGTEDSIVTVSGHGVFVTTIATLVKDGDLVLHDALAHDCIMAGAKLSGAKRRPFPHNDWRALEKQLATLRPHYRRVLIAIEGVYSMDGDSPDLPKFIELKKKYGCLLLVDEAHSIGVMGQSGGGIGEHFGVHRPDVDLWMGTLSKSFASCGGYVGGSKALVQFLKYSAGGFVYSVGISPANAAAALEALRQLRAHPEKVARLHERASLFLRLAKQKGIDTGSSSGSAVVPAILGNSMHALQVSDALKQRGINVQPILYPAVEETAARLRFFCTATHTEQQIRETIDVLAEEIDRVRAESATGSD
ncbi:MAG TPA: aminotransferase class I/II-fold pyridoxal phosphate-dependent enzyme [Myxococcales bacterium]